MYVHNNFFFGGGRGLFFFLHPLTHPNCTPTSSPDDAGQQPMRLCLFRVVLNRVIQMLELLVSYPAQGGDQVPKLIPHVVALGLPSRDHLDKLADLPVVVAANLGLDGLGARHGRLLAHHGRRPAEPRGHDGPQRVERRGADAVLGDQRVEGCEVGSFLVVHVLHEAFQVRFPAEDRRSLSGVDQGRRQLAGLVYPEGAGEDELLLGG